MVAPLPAILAGPVVRRTTPDRVFVWLALTRIYDPLHLALYIGGAVTAQRIPCDCEWYPLELGKRLFVYLLVAKPKVPLTPGSIYSYDVLINGLHPLFGKADLEQIVLRGHARPSFRLGRTKGRDIHALYGSCRKLHGPPPDMMQAAEVILQEAKPNQRPEYLFLGGDQIYADDVHASLLAFSTPLRATLFPLVETIPGLPHAAYSPVTSRAKALDAFFTSSHKDHHLLSFAEYACVYLLAWNPAIWDYLRSFSGSSGRSVPRHMFNGAKRARRVLANVITYMTFDDHEVTDDWFRTENWTTNLEKHKAGKRIIANGMAAYWIFQGWGNDPDSFDEAFRASIQGYVLSRGHGTNKIYQDLGSAPWSFVAPTTPPVLFLDTRTRRATSKAHKDPYDFGFQRGSIHPFLPGPGGQGIQHGPTVQKRTRNVEAPRLLDQTEKGRLAKLLQTHVRRSEPLIVIAPSPIYGYPPMEWLQARLGKRLPDTADLESWAVNPRNLIDAVELFAERDPDPLIILSGDVHYGFEVTGRIWHGVGSFPMLQLCSSAIKNKPIGARDAGGLAALSLFWNKDQWRIYWDWNRGADGDGPIASMDALSNQTDVFDDLYGERCCAIATQFVRRSGRTDAHQRIETENNIGEIEIVGDVTWHRHWTVDQSGKSVVRPWLSWDKNRWPIDDLFQSLRDGLRALLE